MKESVYTSKTSIYAQPSNNFCLLNKEGNIPEEEIEFPTGRRKTELLRVLSFHYSR